MKQFFTIHGGEYLLGNIIEKKFPDWEIWIPSKDLGTDFLITNKKNRQKNVSIQVKSSKDYLVFPHKPEEKKRYRSLGWWSLNLSKIKDSSANFWIFVIESAEERVLDCIIIEKEELYKRIRTVHGSKNGVKIYRTI